LQSGGIARFMMPFLFLLLTVLAEEPPLNIPAELVKPVEASPEILPASQIVPALKDTPETSFNLEGPAAIRFINQMMQNPETAMKSFWNAMALPPFYRGFIPVAQPNNFLADSTIYPISMSSQANFSRPVRGQDSTFTSYRQDMALTVPLSMTNPAKMLFFTLGLRWVHTETQAILPDSQRAFPQDLGVVQPGFFYRQVFNNGWSMNLGASLASPSDKPFNSYREIAPSVIGTLRMDRDNGDAWVASITYLPVELSPFPIPGIAYNYVDENIDVMIGVPFEVQWRFADNWSIEAGWLPVRRIRSQLTWQPDAELAFFAGFDWTNDNYLLSNRTNRDDFLFIYEKRVSGGIRFHPHQNITLDLVGGYGFDRTIFQGQKYDDRHQDRIDILSGPFGLVRLGIRF
jgi:hypothetical protein